MSLSISINSKPINDSSGHVEGDESSDCFGRHPEKSRAPHKDFSARYGGDEFTLICIRAKTDTGFSLMDETQRLLDNYNEQSNKPYSLSISYGIASYTEDSSATEEALKHQADRLMYEMKAVHHRDM